MVGLCLIEPEVHYDSRGYFFESFNHQAFNDMIESRTFIQDNESKSSKGVLRGLHFQKPPYEQAKLVRCTLGKVLDVVVDLRLGSKTYGNHQSFTLSEENKLQLFIPPGFAHGFIVLSEEAVFSYKVDNQYAPESDSGIIWNDPDLSIDWGLPENEITISEKDSNLKMLAELKSPFN